MTNDIILFIVILIFIILSLFYIIKQYKKASSEFEKTIYIALIITIFFPYIIYILDRFNLPSKLGYIKNLNSKDWISILSNYGATFISVLISQAFLIYVTKMQIESEFKNNRELNSEEQRLNNIPILRYNISFKNGNENMLDIISIKISKNDKRNDSINFIFSIKNIGLNTARKIYMQIKSNNLVKTVKYENNSQTTLAVNETIQKEFILHGYLNNIINLDIIVYYQDLLKNWYKQELKIEIQLTNYYKSNNNKICKLNLFKVNDEELIEAKDFDIINSIIKE